MTRRRQIEALRVEIGRLQRQLDACEAARTKLRQIVTVSAHAAKHQRDRADRLQDVLDLMTVDAERWRAHVAATLHSAGANQMVYSEAEED